MYKDVFEIKEYATQFQEFSELPQISSTKKNYWTDTAP